MKELHKRIQSTRKTTDGSDDIKFNIRNEGLQGMRRRDEIKNNLDNGRLYSI